MDAHAYVDECLSREDRIAFEARLRNDPELRRQVDLWQAQNDAIRAAFRAPPRARGPLSVGRPFNENVSAPAIDSRRARGCRDIERCARPFTANLAGERAAIRASTNPGAPDLGADATVGFDLVAVVGFAGAQPRGRPAGRARPAHRRGACCVSCIRRRFQRRPRHSHDRCPRFGQAALAEICRAGGGGELRCHGMDADRRALRSGNGVGRRVRALGESRPRAYGVADRTARRPCEFDAAKSRFRRRRHFGVDRGRERFRGGWPGHERDRGADWHRRPLSGKLFRSPLSRCLGVRARSPAHLPSVIRCHAMTAETKRRFSAWAGIGFSGAIGNGRSLARPDPK